MPGGRPKGSKDGPGVTRNRRTLAAQVAAELEAKGAARVVFEGMKPGDKPPLRIINDILNGRGNEYIESAYPLKPDVAIRLLGLAIPYTAARLQSIEVKTDDDQRKRIKQIEEIHGKAIEGNAEARARHAEAKAVIEKLDEADVTVLRKALGISEAGDVEAAEVER